MSTIDPRLLQAFDPLFPIGAYTMSNGLETYVQKGLVTDGLCRYLEAYLYTLPYGDLGFAAKAAEGYDLAELDGLCAASKSPYELRTGSEKLCRRFLKTETALGYYPLLEEYAASGCLGYYPVAAGLFIRELGTDIAEGLTVYCYSLLSAAVNHAVKLVPLGQLEGQSALYDILPEIPEAVKAARDADIADLGCTGPGFDLRAMQHEGLYSRLYIS